MPGYVRVHRKLVVTNELLRRMPKSESRKHLADTTGQLLSEALQTGTVDTTFPIFIDSARHEDLSDFSIDAQELKITLDYKERAIERDEITAGWSDADRRAFQQAKRARELSD